ncbi:CPBP family intramembrane glutamic endopeptidase [Rhodobacter sp. SY28-1]|uniref:CPBP family intramembrane glutamic endopeptidase n=1 Tax=Rhodobacter sp. SY28-1 TaxID=2562317 RepID=UPI0014852ADB|nr:type II CAAX endopeptidase family protein [Rhodobacter sp. SY28-1]
MNKRLALALLAFVCWLAITIVVGNIANGGETDLGEGVQRGIGWAWLAAGGFILAVVLWQGWHDVALNCWPEARAWRLTWLPMIYIVIALGVSIFFSLPPAMTLLIILFNTLLVGFSEELMLRGALLQGFRHTVSILPAVLLTSVAFGAMHSLNVFVTGNLWAALLQSCAAFLSGIVFIALRLRTGSLWPSVIVHALWDFATFTLGAAVGHASSHGTMPAEAVTPAPGSGLTQFLPILLVLPNAIYGLWLMRNISRTHANPET